MGDWSPHVSLGRYVIAHTSQVKLVIKLRLALIRATRYYTSNKPWFTQAGGQTMIRASLSLFWGSQNVVKEGVSA